MALSRKTSILNFFRRFFTNPPVEKLLLRLVAGKLPTHFFSRLLPMPYLYKKPSWRSVVRNGLALHLDLSDLVDWHVYYALRDESYDFLFNKIGPDDVVLDVGSNIGYVAMRCAQKAKNGAVFGFEPSSYNFNKCQQNLKSNSLSNVQVENMGIGQREGSLQLVTVDPNNRGMNKMRGSESIPEEQMETIGLSTIDHWLTQRHLNRLTLIKIDVEGFEMEVLKGAEEAIRRFSPTLFIELNNSYLRRFGSSARELIEWLTVRNYAIFDVAGNPIGMENTPDFHLDIFARHSE